MEQDEVRTLRRLRDLHLNLIEPKIVEYRGRVFKTMGDGFLAEFVSVVDAVHCAVDIQRMMAARNLDLPEDNRLNLRMGVNLGDVFCEGEDVFGDGVNIAARLESIAPPGGIYISRAVCDPSVSVSHSTLRILASTTSKISRAGYTCLTSGLTVWLKVYPLRTS